MSLVGSWLSNLRANPDRIFVQEARDGELWASTGADLLARVQHARAAIRAQGLGAGDRCALLAANSIEWVAIDLALMAEGVVVVPLYARARPTEIAQILRDAQVSWVLTSDPEAAQGATADWSDAPPIALLSAVAAPTPPARGDAPPFAPVERDANDPLTIIYTSGTSGEPKGVVLTAANVEFVLDAAGRHLDKLMKGCLEDERVFHYLPFCFAGSWMLLLLCLTRRSLLTLNTDLTRITEDLALAPPHYFQNVPVLLERVRAGVEQALDRRSGILAWIWSGARQAGRADEGESVGFGLSVRLTLARLLLFPTVRKRIGPRLRALVCGSAALNRETQVFFEMIGVPILQVYGLTETTAICTMDEPGAVVAGRVGCAIPGIEMRVNEANEVLVRGPHIFAGYWNAPQATLDAFEDGWFRTGDLGEVDAQGNWKIVGRAKNLIVPSSGHNIAPEPLEEALSGELAGAAQVVLIGSGRPFLTVMVTGAVTQEQVETAVERINAGQPHYGKIRASLLHPQPFTIESGLLTANGKLRREAIARHFTDEIDRLYEERVPA